MFFLLLLCFEKRAPSLLSASHTHFLEMQKIVKLTKSTQVAEI